MSNLSTYKNVFQNVFGVDAESLNETFTFSSIEKWDSLTHLTLISELETAFNVMFETEDILQFGGFLNGIEILKRYGIDFSE